MELITIDNRAKLQIKKKIPIGEILSQHRQVYKLETSIGDIVLQKIKHTDSDEVTAWLLDNVEGYWETLEEIGRLQEIQKYDKGLNADQMCRLKEIGRFLDRHTKHYSVKCFLEPENMTIEMLDAIYSQLQPEERLQLNVILPQLYNPELDGVVDLNGLSIAERYNIPLAHDLTMENMTAQQARSLTKAQEEEGRILNEMLKP